MTGDSPTRTPGTPSPTRSTKPSLSKRRPGPGRRPSSSSGSCRILSTGRAEGPQHRRGHLHREGRGRAEAAAARGARTRADRCRRARSKQRLDDALAQTRRSARQHDPRILCGTAARASGRGARRSAVHRSHRRRRRSVCSTRRSAVGFRRSSRDPPEGHPARAATVGVVRLQPDVARGWTDRPRAARRLGAGAVARFRRALDARTRSTATATSTGSIAELHEFAALTTKPSYAKDNLFLDTAPARHLSQEIALHQSFGHTDYDGWEARLVDLSRDRNFAKARHGRGPGYGAGVARDAVLTASSSFAAISISSGWRRTPISPRPFSRSCARAIERYEELKHARRCSRLSRPAAQGARPGAQRCRAFGSGFQKRFTHIFVDEFQDTDPLQAEILLLLAAADPAANRLAHRHARARTPVHRRRSQAVDLPLPARRCRDLPRSLRAPGDGGARIVKLTTSFRSVPGIQACVNAAFAPVMTGDTFTLQAAYVPLLAVSREPRESSLPSSRCRCRSHTARATSRRLRSKRRCRMPSAPSSTGCVTESKWKVTERSRRQAGSVAGAPHLHPLPPLHLVWRRRHDAVRAGAGSARRQARAGRRQDVSRPRRGRDASAPRSPRSSGRTTSCRCLRRCADRCSRSATRSCSTGSSAYSEFLPIRSVPPEARGRSVAHLQPIVDALQTTEDSCIATQLHPGRRHDPQLLNATRAHVALVLRPAGEQALANVLHVAELARQYEANGGISFRGFVDELRIAAETAQAAEAPILEEGSDGVRMMTVHKAKGLEFPVVILADLTCRLSRTEAGRWIDRREQPVRAEDRRLGAGRSAAPRRRGGVARQGGVGAPDLRRRHPRPRSARGADHRRWRIRRRLARSADARRSIRPRRSAAVHSTRRDARRSARRTPC